MQGTWREHDTPPPNFQLPFGLQLKSVSVNFLSRDGGQGGANQLQGEDGQIWACIRDRRQGCFSFGFTFPLCKVRTVTPTHRATERKNCKKL